MNPVAARLAEVQARMAAACTRAGRDPASVTLVGVTKTVAVPTISPASPSRRMAWAIDEAMRPRPIRATRS